MSLAWAINKHAQRGAVVGDRSAGGQRKTIQAPVDGWNTSDAYATMPPKYAVVLENFFPEAGSVSLRRGSRTTARGVGTGYVSTLIPHESGSVRRLYAVGGGQLWNVTNNAQVAIDATSLKNGSYTSDRWRWASMAGHTIMVNGEDVPELILPDGSVAAANAAAWTKAAGQDAITFSASRLAHVLPFKGRVYFLEKDSPNLWYGNLGAVRGDLTRFALDRVHAEGGNAIGIDTVTVDAGSGVDDLLLIFFDTGSVLVYQGSDPTSAGVDGLRQVGIWKLGRLIGDRATVKYGGDLIAMTVDGYVSMKQTLQGGRVSVSRETSNISLKIANTITERYRQFGGNSGWDCVLFTPATWLLFSVPLEGGEQHVMNTQTGAWCRLTGMDARCWTVWNDRLFFGGPGGTVVEANVARDDDGDLIEGDVQGAFQYLGTAMDKRFTMARALVDSDGDVSFRIGVTTDFNDPGRLAAATEIATSGAEWDTAEWDVAEWAGGTFSLQEWQGLNEDGTAISVRLRSSTRGASLRYFACDVVTEPTIALL